MPISNRALHNVLTLCRLSMLAALYVLLNMLSIRAGDLRITFASLPVTVCALLFGPGEAALTALMGEFINQLTGPYGITATLPLWLIPPAVRGLVIGGLALRARRAGRPLESRPAALYAVCAAAALATTVCNTGAMLADSLLFRYWFPGYALAQLGVRTVTGVLTAVVIASVAMPLAALLRRQRLVRV